MPETAPQWGEDEFPDGDRELWDAQYMRGREVEDTIAGDLPEGRVLQVDLEQFHRDIVPDPDPKTF
jgi:hypothetical protein